VIIPTRGHYFIDNKAAHLVFLQAEAMSYQISGLIKLIGGNRNEKHVGKNKEGSAEGS
jgi:hypothetical protein